MSPFRLQPASRLPCNDVSAYCASKRIALAHEIGPKKKIYLDTKYWVLLRDVRLGRASRAAWRNCSHASKFWCVTAMPFAH